MRRYVSGAIATFLLVGVAIALAVSAWKPGAATGPRTGLAAIRVPPGFQVEKVTVPELVSYPMMGTVDDRGRLFLCESSGGTVQTAEMAANPTYRIRLLEDLNGDGVYDRSRVFADKLTLPAGAVRYRGSLYVAAPPDLLRFDDVNGDGVADRREVVVTGWNLSANAASLHGPVFGPDGWLYLTDGRHGYKITTKEKTVLQGMASRIWRCRPDGTGLEWVAGGGFDNPVEVVFTPSGEMIGTMTYFTDPKDGQRDSLLHFVDGGVYPKWHPVVAEFKRTGDLMPVMTKFARIAPSGLLRFRGLSFGPRYHGNLFSAQFNTHRVQRHILSRAGATFRTEDEDFLVSTDPDFHPTDVIQDRDGSLLVLDTGAWFIHGCPVSRVAKPQIRGGVYRVWRKGQPRYQVPRLQQVSAEQLVRYLEDSRPAVQDQAAEKLVEAGNAAVAALASFRSKSESVEARCSAVFVLARIGTPEAKQAVRAALGDPHFEVRIAAARMAGMARDAAAIPPLLEMAGTDAPPARRQAAAALGRIGDKRAVPPLLAAASGIEDRFIEHAIIYSLILLKHPRTVAAGLLSVEMRVSRGCWVTRSEPGRSIPNGRCSCSAPSTGAL